MDSYNSRRRQIIILKTHVRITSTLFSCKNKRNSKLNATRINIAYQFKSAYHSLGKCVAGTSIPAISLLQHFPLGRTDLSSILKMIDKNEEDFFTAHIYRVPWGEININFFFLDLTNDLASMNFLNFSFTIRCKYNIRIIRESAIFICNIALYTFEELKCTKYMHVG